MPQRQAGLLYSQFYSSVKEIWQHIGGGLSHDPVALTRAYLYIKRRCHTALQGSSQKIFGLREEHRVSWDLFRAIHTVMRGQYLYRTRIPRTPVAEAPFYSLPTPTLLSWLYWSINKFCIGFKMVYSLNNRHFVTWEHTRVILMFLRCLQFLYTGGLLQRVSGCWRDIWFQPDPRQPDGLRRREGLGFQQSMERYGYTWLLDKLDWGTMTFRYPFALYMMFDNPSLQAAYRARYAQVRDVRQDFLRIIQIHRWMEEFSAVLCCLELLEDLLQQLCLCIFRKDVFTHVQHLLRPEHVARALAGEVPLYWSSVEPILIESVQPPVLLQGNRVAVKSIDTLYAWLWEWKDGQYDRHGWKDKPYRMVYRQGYEIIQQIRD
ncbi:hypothetical protein BDV26DRAFT_299204 [Aspergillus bertholletiae]|uniref:Uncharacterized protein n=1 Tax=Aspergillus bertholletiae TaxID=1226010 RepID=A0A5N7ANZ1_9EURO|nr:hypothetical protein BDV26DRAFT_299204 [Aspergillus bertholletiae]